MFKFCNITKIFNGNLILDDVSIEIEPAALQFLTGKSGSGKTTLLKILAGIENYQDDTNQKKYVKEKSISYIPQVNSLWNNLTVKDNVLLYRKLILKESETIALKKCEWLFEILNITDKLNRYPAKLSSGEHQRVAIARALASDNSLMLLDETTSNLDFENKEIIKNIIKTALERGKSFLFISHDLHFISQFTDQCLVLENTKITNNKISDYVS